MNSSLWTFASASVLGASHITSGTTCQDSNAIKPSDDGQWVAMVASDGAGTASKSDVSSKFIVHEFTDALIEIASELVRRPPGAWVTDAIIEHIVRLRKQLRSMANSDDISSFHCTLVAALVGPSGGITIHLGDGAVFGGRSGQADSKTLDLSQDYLLSLPQNGEYANETVFMTERDWVKHLRIDPLPDVDWLILGTDGGMALAMVGEKLPKTGFIKPVLEALMLRGDQASHDRAVRDSLSDKQADRLTNDDKTLCALVRSKFTHVEGAIQERSPAVAFSIPVPSATSNLVNANAPSIKSADTNVPPKLALSSLRPVVTISLSRRELVLLGVLILCGVFVFLYRSWSNYQTTTAVNVGVAKVRTVGAVGEVTPAKPTTMVQVTEPTDKPRGGDDGPMPAERGADTDISTDQRAKP